MDTATKTGIDAAEISLKRVVQKTAEATGDLTENKIAIKLLHQTKQRVKKKVDKKSTCHQGKQKVKEKKKKNKKCTYHQKKDSKY